MVVKNVNTPKSSDFPPSQIQNHPTLARRLAPPYFKVFHFSSKNKKNHRFRDENGGFYGCGGRTRTYDLRVMSPTSYQLLYSAIFRCTP